MTRIFKYGDNTFQDPGDEFTTDDVKQSLAHTFPEIAQATVSEKTLDDGDVEITFIKRSGVKGRR